MSRLGSNLGKVRAGQKRKRQRNLYNGENEMGSIQRPKGTYFSALDYKKEYFPLATSKNEAYFDFQPILFANKERTDFDYDAGYYIYYKKHFQKKGSEHFNCLRIAQYDCPYCDNKDYNNSEYVHFPAIIFTNSNKENEVVFDFKMIEMDYQLFMDYIEPDIDAILEGDYMVSMNLLKRQGKDSYGYDRSVSIINCDRDVELEVILNRAPVFETIEKALMSKDFYNIKNGTKKLKLSDFNKDDFDFD